MQGIYMIKNKINNKIYIGKSIKIENRWYQHRYSLNNNLSSNLYLQASWNKYGEENFEFSIIELIENNNLLNNKEIYWINKFNSTNKENGYNITSGGDGRSCSCSDQTKKKISNSLIGMFSGENHHMYGKHHSDETIRKISQSNMGKKLSNEHKLKISKKSKMYKHSDITKEKIRLGNTGKIISDKTREKISKANKGKKISNETKEKISNSLKGREAWNKGKTYNLKPLTAKTKEKISQSQKGNNYRTIISDEMIPNIINRISNGEKVKDLAIEFKVKETTIYSLKRRMKK